jgi:hypothetical protein
VNLKGECYSSFFEEISKVEKSPLLRGELA